MTAGGGGGLISLQKTMKCQLQILPEQLRLNEVHIVSLLYSDQVSPGI